MKVKQWREEKRHFLDFRVKKVVCFVEWTNEIPNILASLKGLDLGIYGEEYNCVSTKDLLGRRLRGVVIDWSSPSRKTYQATLISRLDVRLLEDCISGFIHPSGIFFVQES